MEKTTLNSRRKSRHVISLSCLMTLLASSAHAQIIGAGDTKAFPKTNFQPDPQVSTDEPVLLAAETVNYDQENDTVTAAGKVEVTQGETILLADKISYNQQKDVVTAQGHVSLLEPTGNVYFANELELKSQMKVGVIRNFKARLADNSLMVANAARRISENKMELFKVAYTPCKCGADGPDKPQWQVSADHVLLDQDDNRVYYDNAYFSTYGVPILYTPYLSHPTPDAENQSGILSPEYRHSSNLGSVFKLPVYMALAPDKDMTITPMITSDEGLVMIGQYRQKFDRGQMQFDGSITNPERLDAAGDPIGDNETRGHIDATGKFRLFENDNYDWGFDIHRATDDTYLRRYSFSNVPLLTSRVYAEGFNFIEGADDRTYANVEALSFQGLTADDDRSLAPTILPQAEFTTQSQPGWNNSRFTFYGNMLSLFRSEGTDSRRIVTSTGWKLPYITNDGQIIEANVEMRADLYGVDDVALPGGGNFDGTPGRAVPQGSVLWRYPFINQWENSSLMIEPIVLMALSPNTGNTDKIPNEDSLVPEFTDTNLFSPNRYAGWDRIETGPRIAYGLRGQAQFYNDKYVDWLVGQNYRTHNDPNFPYSNDLYSSFSDYVGKVGIAYAPIYMAYRFRLDKDKLTVRRNELDATVNYYPVTISTSYLELRNDPILANKKNVGGHMGINLSREWIWNTNGTRDLELDKTTSISTGLTYKSECTQIVSLIGREFTRDRDLEPSTTFLLQLSLKNLE